MHPVRTSEIGYPGFHAQSGIGSLYSVLITTTINMASSVANLIQTGRATRIVVVAGAGISTSTGIPDFRTPETGLYAKVAPLKLPYPEAIFNISYFRHTPEPFYAIAKARHPRRLCPTVSHAFLALLARKGLLCKLFTQNIDGLERKAGVPAGRVFATHGSWATQRCLKCKAAFSDDLMMEAIESGYVPYCQVEGCGGVVKPDVVFFGECLPAEYEEEERRVVEADLVLVMGTSLKVHPTARIPGLVKEGVTRVLINLERVGDFGKRPEDVCMLGECDEGVRALADALGWRGELEELWREIAPNGGDVIDDNDLDQAIENLRQEMERAGKISDGHKRMLEKHLEEKFADILPG